MPSKYFPIRTDTACQLKWNWSTLYLYQGKTASCHRTGRGDITADTFNSFHNLDNKIKERQQMLLGKWPDNSCQYCRNIEEIGGFSDRMLHLDIPNLSPVELESNLTATIVTPTILEVYFNNICNLACLYCVPTLSSRINQENKKFGKFNQDGVLLESVEISSEHSKLIEKFWDWMHINSSKLKRLNILGGEPLYQTEFDECLSYFETTSHPDLELCIVTNLMIGLDKLEVYIDKFKKLLVDKQLKRIDITCSIDCLGPEQEYVRYGINLETWMKNFEFLLKQKWLTLNINQTISVLTIKTMPELINKLNSWRQQRPVGHYFSEVSPQPTYMSVTILGASLFEKDFELIVSTMSENTEQDRTAKQYMNGIAKKALQSNCNLIELKKLKTFLTEKDRRRGTNWRKTFPWLITELENVV